MRVFISTHKKELVIAAVIILLASFAVALYVNYKINSTQSEAVPQGRIHDAGVFTDDVKIYDSTEGEIIIGVAVDTTAIEAASAPKAMKLITDPDSIWAEDIYAGSHTPVEKAKMTDGSIGVLTVDKLKISVNVYESPDTMEDMDKGIAHFASTSAWDGNVGFSAHNVNFDGSDGYFKNLHTLKNGDLIHYKTALGERGYTVTSVSTIAASDWSSLYYEDSNQLTLITCISGQPDKRLCVKASEQTPE